LFPGKNEADEKFRPDERSRWGTGARRRKANEKEHCLSFSAERKGKKDRRKRSFYGGQSSSAGKKRENVDPPKRGEKEGERRRLRAGGPEPGESLVLRKGKETESFLLKGERTMGAPSRRKKKRRDLLIT